MLDDKIVEAENAPSRAQRILVPNDIIFQTVRPYQQNNYFYEKERDLPSIASTGYAVIRTKQDARFIYSLIHTQRFLTPVMQRCTGSSYPAVTGTDLEDISVWIPCLKEQKRIGALLGLIGKKIDVQTKLIETLKKDKRGLLSTIFSKVTTFVHLKDICEYASSAKTMSQIDNTPKGACPVYDAGGVAAFVDFYDMDTNYIAIIKDGSGVGRLQFCQAKSSFIGTLGGLIPKNCSALYLYTALQTIDFKEYVTGMAIPHIYYKDYKEAMLPYPCEEERAKIEIVFQYLDDKIAKAELLLTKLNELKKSFLQQLFI